MGALLRFFSKNALFVFFIFLQLVAVVLIFSKNSMQQSFLAAKTAAFNSWVDIDPETSRIKTIWRTLSDTFRIWFLECKNRKKSTTKTNNKTSN